MRPYVVWMSVILLLLAITGHNKSRLASSNFSPDEKGRPTMDELSDISPGLQLPEVPDEEAIKNSELLKIFKSEIDNVAHDIQNRIIWEHKEKLREQEEKFREQEKKLLEQEKKTLVLNEQHNEVMKQLAHLLEQKCDEGNDKEEGHSKGGGVTYVRWGRTECEPEDTDILYRGFAGTSSYNTHGGGSNIVCLHNTPELLGTHAHLFGASNITGVEYGAPGATPTMSPPFSLENNNGQSLGRQDMPCSVCHVHTRSAQLMIPGHSDCPNGWFREYWGYLVSPLSEHAKSADYVCLDRAPESIAGGAGGTVSSVVYLATAQCGLALPCPPYSNTYALPCAVCSK